MIEVKKLSERSTDEVANYFCVIAAPAENIITDNDFVESIGKGLKTDGMTQIGVLSAAMSRITKLIPILLKTHRIDMYTIISEYYGIEPEEIGKQTFLKTLKMAKDAFNDKELMAFFKSLRGQEASE